MPDLGSFDMTLLYVEDDASVRSMVSAQLARRFPGVRIFEAGDGVEGLALYRSLRPDLVLTDVTMPAMDGIAMSGQIKELDPDAVIVVITAAGETDYLLRAIEAGITGYLLKPLSYRQLFSLVDRKLRYLCLKKDLERKNDHVRKLSWAVEHSPVSVVISDREGTIEYVNLKFQQLTGFSTEDVIGRNVNLQKSGQTPPETYLELWRTIRGGGTWQGEFLNRKKNGELYWERASISPIFDDQGSITHYVALKEDVTEHRRMVHALEKSQRKFATLFRAVPALILISTIDDCIVVEVNETFLHAMQYQRHEIVGRHVAELAVWASEVARREIVAAVLRQREVQNLEITLVARGGERMVGILSTATFELDDRTFLMSVIRDISERKEREAEIERLNATLAARAAELETANRELEAFNSMIAHDLRNPLNAINSYSQVVNELCGERLDATCREYLNETYQGTLRMNRLIDALLDFSRLAHREPSREAVDLSALVEEVAGELLPQEGGCAVSFEIEQGVSATCDPSLLRIVLHNLLGNALKYNCGRGELRVAFGTRGEPGPTVYFVADDGVGFDPSDAELIFQPFRRLPSPDGVPGHGIGLATVERIVKRHGGAVWAEGRPGEGATFCFTLEPGGGAGGELAR